MKLQFSIPRAELARESAQSSINHEANKNLQLVEQKVKEAIQDGKMQVFINGSIHVNVTRELRAMGYTVDSTSDFRETLTTIKWG